jgi:hypothetical protein
MPRRTGIGHGSPSSILKRAYPAERRITGLDVVIVRDEKIAALYVFLDPVQS